MLQHKRYLAGLLAAAMTFSLAACGNSSEQVELIDNPNQAAADGTMELTEWEQSSGIFNTDETDEELYEKAKEEGKVTIYSISSRITKVAEAFMEKYPGIEVESFDISTNELLEKVSREYNADQHFADVIHIKDEDGTLYNEYVKARKFYNYKPADILSHIDEKYTAEQTPMYLELVQLFYNEEAYPDGAPIENIWEVTLPEWKGRVMMQNPLDNLSWGSWITGFCVGDTPDLLAEAYKELTGEELELSEGCENAAMSSSSACTTTSRSMRPPPMRSPSPSAPRVSPTRRSASALRPSCARTRTTTGASPRSTCIRPPASRRSTRCMSSASASIRTRPSCSSAS